MLKAIGFDLDNTLYDQKQFEYFAFWHVATEVSKYYGINKNNYFSMLKDLFNKGIYDFTFDRAIKLCKGEIPKDWGFFVKTKLLRVYRSAKPKLKLFNWVESFLTEAISKKLKLVIITNGGIEIQNYFY